MSKKDEMKQLAAMKPSDLPLPLSQGNRISEKI